MKKTLLIILAIVAVLYFIISALKNQWNPLKWFGYTGTADGTPCNTGGVTGLNGTYKNGTCVATPPAEGSVCQLMGKAGTIINGTCVVAASASRYAMQQAPQTISVRRISKVCAPTYTYMGAIYTLSQTTSSICYYTRAQYSYMCLDANGKYVFGGSKGDCSSNPCGANQSGGLTCYDGK